MNLHLNRTHTVMLCEAYTSNTRTCAKWSNKMWNIQNGLARCIILNHFNPDLRTKMQTTSIIYYYIIIFIYLLTFYDRGKWLCESTAARPARPLIQVPLRFVCFTLPIYSIGIRWLTQWANRINISQHNGRCTSRRTLEENAAKRRSTKMWKKRGISHATPKIIVG